MVTVPVSLGLVATGARRAGHEVDFLDLLSDSGPAGAVRDTVVPYRPDVIGISIRNIDNQNAAEPRFLLEQSKLVVDACRAASQAPIRRRSRKPVRKAG